MSPRQPRKNDGPRPRRSIERKSSLARRPPGARAERKRFLIFCEGETEEGYFLGMRLRGGPVLEIVNPRADHVRVIAEAHRRRCSDDFDDGDEVWCVLDTELDSGLVKRMQAEAGSQVRLALSTPCFDFWLLLHHKDHRAPFQTASEAEKALKSVVPGWSKGGTRYADFKAGVADACRRARALDPEAEDQLRNPSTAVWKLVQAIGLAGGGTSAG
ncbi:RloB family protein [Nonomuraea sp. B1E8]|uniref:RloB family protein n=1 Tax=unclassified Nonomuraea TaxID=2593643 RepID=UPI00325D997B